MSKHTELTFDDFIAIQNRGAPSSMLGHGLGLSPDVLLETTMLARTTIGETLREQGIPEDKLMTLRDILTARLRPFFAESPTQAQSMLDIITLGLIDGDSIRNFLQKHGVNLDEPQDLAYAAKVFEEAIDVLEDTIYRGKQKVHAALRKVKTAEGIYAVFKTAAGHGKKTLIPQACALLKIAAVINYIERDPMLSILDYAEATLIGLVNKYIQKNQETGQYFFVTGIDGDFPIALANFELRSKTRKRIIAKLLHKPSNRAEEVLDHIGFRITTYNPVETLRLIHQMFFHPEHPLFPSTYIIIGHTKNRLFDERQMLEVLGDPMKAQDLVMSLAEPTLNHAELTTISGPNRSDDNPHSASTYHAIHIVFELPITTQRGERRLFPIEIQLLDTKTSRSNEETAPHNNYIEGQMEDVEERVLGNNLATEWAKRFGR